LQYSQAAPQSYCLQIIHVYRLLTPGTTAFLYINQDHLTLILSFYSSLVVLLIQVYPSSSNAFCHHDHCFQLTYDFLPGMAQHICIYPNDDQSTFARPLPPFKITPSLSYLIQSTASFTY
jgi:hypothetical protein